MSERTVGRPVGGDAVTGFRSDWGCDDDEMNVDDRIRFLLRTAIRAEGGGDLRVALLFRRMAEELCTGESAFLAADGPVLGARTDRST
jgi:hypothetical protein